MNKITSPLLPLGPHCGLPLELLVTLKGWLFQIILEQSEIEESVEMSVDGEKMIMSKSKNTVRESWAKYAQSIAMEGEDGLDQIRPVDKARLVKK